jgi:uncharacterized protein (DUF58 family)
MNTLPVQVTAKSKLILGLIGILIILAILDDYQGWRFLLFVLSALWALSYAWARSLAHGLSLRREMRFGWAQVGDQLEERFHLANHSAFPAIWIEIIDQSNMPDYQVNIVTGLDANGSQQWRSRGLCTRRGLFNLGPTTLRSADPLGLFEIKIHYPGFVTLMVTPPVVPLPAIEVAPGGRVGEGRPRPNALERTINSAGVREYNPGDSLRWIHWRTSARRDNYFVKIFDNTPSGNWWIVVDVEESVQAGASPRSTEEHSVILAASLADKGLRAGLSVGLAAHGKPFTWIPPQEGDGQRWAILRSLALLSPSQHTLTELLFSLRPAFSNYSSLILITSNARGDWIQKLLPFVWKGNVPTVLLLDPRSFGGDASIQPVIQELNRFSIRSHLITPDLLERPEAHPGELGQWKWRVTPSGRAIPVNPPSENAWRVVK